MASDWKGAAADVVAAPWWEHQVCKQGKKLSADQAALLRHFDVKMARFKMFLAAEWVKEGAGPPLPNPN
jgi:hypothetical protein